MDWTEVTKHLAAPLDPAAIKPPPQGKFGEYVDGLHVIREANRIFGFNGWSYVVTRLERTHYDVVDLTGNNGPYKQLRTSYLCAVRVTVDGVIREGLAVGVGNGKPENAGDVIESAVKEAETDALKRALRTFGNTFGLALYDKDKANREVAQPKPSAQEIASLKGRMLTNIDASAKKGTSMDVVTNHAGYKADIERLRGMDPDAADDVEIAIEKHRTPKTEG
jgi:DNA recombination protein Rad52